MSSNQQSHRALALAVRRGGIIAFAALHVELAHSMLAAMFFLSEGFKLTSGERVKGTRDPKFLWFYSTNACSATPLPATSGTPGLRA
jgi:hypothetical protein